MCYNLLPPAGRVGGTAQLITQNDAVHCASEPIDGRAIVRELPAALDGRVAGCRLHLVARGALCWRSDASRRRPECRKLAPGGDLITCFPCAEGVCCGYLRRRRRSPWPPFSALGAVLRPHHVPPCQVAALRRARGDRMRGVPSRSMHSGPSSSAWR